jgi:hypothetical protein
VLGHLLLVFPAGAFALLVALARRSKAEERAVLAVAAGLLVASALVSPVAPVHDPWTHYLHLRAALAEPWRLLDLWDRPGFTLLATGPAAFGIRAARLAAIVTALVAIAATMRAAAALGLARPWLAGVLTLAQYDFFGQGASTMTELPFAAALAVAILGWAEDRPWLAAAGLGWAGMTRPEAPVFVALGALAILLRWRRAGPAFAAALPFVLYMVVGALVFREATWMVTKNPYAGLVSPRLELAQLAHSYFFTALGLSQGSALILLETVGVLLALAGPARRLRFLLPLVGTSFVLLTFLKIGPTDTWRDSRYLVSIAPALALLAAAGLAASLARLPALAPPALLVAAAVAGAQAVAEGWALVGVPVPALWPALLWAALALAAALSLLRSWIPAPVALSALLLLPLVAMPPGMLSRHIPDHVWEVPSPGSYPPPRT